MKKVFISLKKKDVKTLKLKHHLTESQIQLNLKNSKTTVEFKRWQCLYLIQTIDKISADYLSNLLCLSKSSIYRIVQAYNSKGKATVVPKTKGGRKRCLLPLLEEVNLMNELAEDAMAGKLLTANHIRAVVEAKVGKKVSDDYIWDLFHRHGWKKKKPRPTHPKKDKTQQEEFNKNSRMLWTPF